LLNFQIDFVRGNVVLAVIDDRAAIKRFIHDRANHQILQLSSSLTFICHLLAGDSWLNLDDFPLLLSAMQRFS